MTVLHCIDRLGLGGKERRAVELLKGLASRKNVKCELALMSDEIFYTAINDIDIKIHKLKRKTKRDPSIFIKLYQLCNEVKPDIIHTWESMNSIYAVPVAKLLGIKLVNGMITTAPRRLKPFGKAWLRSKLTFPFSDVILSNSSAGLKSYNAPTGKSFYIHNGFDLSRLKKLEASKIIKKRFNIKTSKVVGMVASFTNRKDYHSYIQAAAQVIENRKDVTFLAIGEGPTFETIKANLPSNCNGKIKVIDKQQNIESIINIFDIGVLTTNGAIHGEGISNSIMEYMALAKPVIATDSGGTNEIVIDNKTGFIVKPSDVKNLVERIDFLIENEDKAKSMGVAGKERVVKDFSLETMTDKCIELYEKCLN